MAEVVKGTIITPDGEQIVATEVLTDEEAKLLREYKKFLQRHDLREAVFCNACAMVSDIGLARHGQPHGCEAFVTPTDIMIRCRCRQRFYRGQTF